MTVFLTIVRAAHYGSCLVLQSIFILLLLAVIPGGRESGHGETAPRESLHRGLRRLTVASLLAAIVSGFLWLWLATASMSGASLSECLQPALLWMVLTQTEPGHVWLLRAGITLGFAIAWYFASRRPEGGRPAPFWIPLCAISAIALTASLAWLGHAGASEGPHENLHLAGDLVHLVAAGIWPAGLAPLAIFLGRSLEARTPSSLLAACVATRRFSALSLVTVGALFASGAANSYFLVGTLDALISTDYGRILMLKIAFSCAAVGIGAWNLLVLTPRLTGAPGSGPDETQRLALSRVKRNVLIEVCLATLILLAIGLLGITEPATHP